MKKKLGTIISLLLVTALLTVPSFASGETSVDTDTLVLTDADWELRSSEDLGDFYALEYVVYVADPVDTTYQCMNIYVPAAYMEGGEYNGYTAETAPIVFVCNVGGYCGTTPETIEGDNATAGGESGSGETATPGLADLMGGSSAAEGSLARGYVVVIPGCRGRDTLNEDGTYNGKGAEGLVDLKAAIRFLRHNADTIPGDMEKIIACGHSAGGALSLMLAITGNVADYEPYLEAIGAADERDDIYAATPTSPITDLENADMAFEWTLPALDSFTELENALHDGLAAAYSAYINSLGLTDDLTGDALTLNSDYTGSYVDYVLRYLSESATVYMQALDETEQEAYLEGKEAWLTWDKDNQTAQVTDIQAFGAYVGRTEGVPQFDALGEDSTANMTFGGVDEDGVHYTTYIANILRAAGYEEYAEAYEDVSALVAEQVRLLSPYTFLGEGDTAAYIRIRMGTKDFFAPSTVSLNIAAALMSETDSEIDYAMLWDVGHDGDIGTDEWFDYIESICRTD